MAIALTPFEALCGFMPVQSIAPYLKHTPEFAALIPQPAIDRFLACVEPELESADYKGPLRDVFSSFMAADAGLVKEQLEILVARYRAGKAHEVERTVVDLVLTLHEQYPGDIGVFCAFLLNRVTLDPGEAIFLGAGEPHAYIAGGR